MVSAMVPHEVSYQLLSSIVLCFIFIISTTASQHAVFSCLAVRGAIMLARAVWAIASMWARLKLSLTIESLSNTLIALYFAISLE